MKKRRPAVDPAHGTASTSPAARTGEHCPDSGWWVAISAGKAHTTPRFIAEGSVMPTVAGSPSLWVPIVAH